MRRARPGPTLGLCLLQDLRPADRHFATEQQLRPLPIPEKFIPLFITNALEGKTLPLYGQERTCATGSTSKTIAGDRAGRTAGVAGETYNIGAGNEVTNIEVAERICDLLGGGAPSSSLCRTAGHDHRYALDSTKMRGLGWAPELKFDEALERTVRWYEANGDGAGDQGEEPRLQGPRRAILQESPLRDQEGRDLTSERRSLKVWE